jgi:tetratricopeptide (TPR) repeat protein
MKSLWKRFLMVNLIAVGVCCAAPNKYTINDEVLYAMGAEHRQFFENQIKIQEVQIEKDSTDSKAYLDIAESQVILFIFGFKARHQTFPQAEEAYENALQYDSTSSESYRIGGILSFLDWDWEGANEQLQKAIRKDPTNLSARHWYSLYLAINERLDESMLQSDTIMTMDPEEDFLIGRGSLLYFLEDYKQLKQMMHRTIAMDTSMPWGYDWLGMAYNGLDEHDQSIQTYLKAFRLSDGTVEVGGGLGHALGDAGEIELAKYMADTYESLSKDYYLPQCQRAFIHLGIGEHEKALDLLEEAFVAKSWFLIFLKIEPWYNPIRKDPRFKEIIRRMEFPA